MWIFTRLDVEKLFGGLLSLPCHLNEDTESFISVHPVCLFIIHKHISSHSGRVSLAISMLCNLLNVICKTGRGNITVISLTTNRSMTPNSYYISLLPYSSCPSDSVELSGSLWLLTTTVLSSENFMLFTNISPTAIPPLSL